MTPALDVLIVSYNTRDDLLRCLASLFAHPPRALGAVVVVDNASRDGSADAVRAAWPAARVVGLDRNIGFAAANNRAITATSSPLVLLLNSDTIVPAGAVDALVDRLVATGAAAAGPRLVDAEGRPEVSVGAPLTTFRRTASPITASACRCTSLTKSWTANSSRSLTRSPRTSRRKS